jgi:predicted RNA-binding Zn-ribbon protein involved in translation (DUF1610 family)
MPNWVNSIVTIKGDSERVLSLKEQVGRPFIFPIKNGGDFSYTIRSYEYKAPIFAFWNILSPLDLNDYLLEPMNSTPNWYDWNIHNWGVKWDVACANDLDTSSFHNGAQLLDEKIEGAERTLMYEFNTPWGVPTEALMELSRQHPLVVIALQYEEETGWGGKMTFLAGAILSGIAWGWKCSACDYSLENENDAYCEDCENHVCPYCGFHEIYEDNTCPIHQIEEKI